jgi:RNA polymerase sigma-70 factor (ECF subfamily)
VDSDRPVVAPARPAEIDAEGLRWVQRLQVSGRDRDAAIAELHALLLPVARSEARRRSAQLQLAGPELDDLAHQALADALLLITAKASSFRGDSRFTTWAYKFVIFEVSSKMSRHFWRRAPVPLDEERWEALPARFGVEPARQSEARELLDAVREAVEHDLTARQRMVFVAIVLNGMPLDELVAELGSNRSAIYKTMFDARRKLRAVLAAKGYVHADVEPSS